MLTLPRNWTFSFVMRTVFGAVGAMIVLNADQAIGQAPGAAAAGGAGAAAAGGAATPGVGGAAGIPPVVTTPLRPDLPPNRLAPGDAIGGVAPGVGANRGTPGVGVGGTAPGVGTNRVTPGVNVPRANAGTRVTPGQRTVPRQSPANQGSLNNQRTQRGAANPQANGQNAAPGSAPAVQGDANTAGAAANANATGRARNGTIPRNLIPGQQPATAARQQAARRGSSGTISGINSNTLTFNNGSASSQLTITGETQVQIDGANATLADLPMNASVQVFTNPNNPAEIQRIVASTSTAQPGPDQAGTSTGDASNQEGRITPVFDPTDPTPIDPTPPGSTRQPSQPPRGAQTEFGPGGSGNDPKQDLRREPIYQPFSADGRTTGTQPAANPQASGAAAAGVPRVPGTPSANSTVRGRAVQNAASSGTGANNGRAGAAGEITRQNFNGPTVDLGWKLQGSGRGVTVSNLGSGGVAAQGGLHDGDVITSINGQSVSSPRDLSFELNRLSPGSKVEFQLQRDGKSVTQMVTLPQTFKPLFPRSAEEIAEENRGLEAQVEAARKRD
jgi:hypothetical protein